MSHSRRKNREICRENVEDFILAAHFPREIVEGAEDYEDLCGGSRRHRGAKKPNTSPSEDLCYADPHPRFFANSPIEG
jgi:hypothetical protein